MIASTFLLLLAVIATVSADQDLGFCCLCDKCDMPVRTSHPVDSKGYTCAALMLDMADPTNHIRAGNGICRQLQSQHRNRCCNRNYNPPSIPQTDVPKPGSEYGYGNSKSCNLCPNGRYPGKPFTRVAVLNYGGISTCKDLYWWLKNGKVEDRMCGPTSYMLGPACGCNQGNPNGGASNPRPSTPSNPRPTRPTWQWKPTPTDGGVGGSPPKKLIPSNSDADKQQDKLGGGTGYTRGNLHRQLNKGE